MPVDMTFAPCAFVSLVGPSCCGPRTLLNILAGFLEPSAGRAFVGGDPITAPDMDRGMVFQDYALFPWLSVIQNVEFGLERKGIGKTERRAIAMNYLSTVGHGTSPQSRPTNCPAA